MDYLTKILIGQKFWYILERSCHDLTKLYQANFLIKLAKIMVKHGNINFTKIKGVKGNQSVVIALFQDIIFLSCSLQDFSHLNKPFCPRILESASVCHRSLKIQFEPPNDVFTLRQLNFIWIAAQNIKKF